jgi:phosphoserine phosphatase
MFFAERLLRWGVTSAHGTRVFAGEQPDPARVLTPASKFEIAAGLMQHYGITKIDCVAYGDSASDIPLFNMLPNTVAVNGSEKIMSLARRHYGGLDLWEAYRIGRTLLEPETATIA